MRERSAAQNRLYWRVLERVVNETAPRWQTPGELHAALRIALHYVDPVTLLNGRRILVPRSIAFDAMLQAEAQVYYDAAFALLAELMDCTVEELLSSRSDTSDTAAAPSPRG